MEQDINIRQAMRTDLRSIYELVQYTFQLSYADVYPLEAIEILKNLQSRESIQIDLETAYVLVAESNDEIIGTGTLSGMCIRRVFIKSEFQRQGIGKLISRKLENKAKSEGLSSLELSATLTSRHFWEGENYAVIEEHSLPVPINNKLTYCHGFYTMSKAL